MTTTTTTTTLVVVAVFANVVVLAKDDDCQKRCWQRVGACVDAENSCFVSCMRHRPLENSCDCGSSSPGVAEEEEEEERRSSRRPSRANMYAGAWVAPWRVVAEARWLPSPQYLEAASWLAFGSARGAFRSGDPRGLRLHHLSAYEHSVIARYAVDEAMDRVRRVAMAELGACSARPTAPFRPRTLALIPFYGGALDLNGRTGNAHSRQPRAIKLAGLVANACALLAGFASRVVVAACRDAGDRFAVEHALRNFSVSAVDVLELSCALPRMLPFVALDAVQQQYRRRYDFLVYNEADQVFHWDSQRAADNAAAFLSTFPSVVLTPHRWHKRYGSDPDCGGSCGMAITGQNLCHHGTPNVDLRLASRRPGHNNNTPTRWS